MAQSDVADSRDCSRQLNDRCGPWEAADDASRRERVQPAPVWCDARTACIPYRQVVPTCGCEPGHTGGS